MVSWEMGRLVNMMSKTEVVTDSFDHRRKTLSGFTLEIASFKSPLAIEKTLTGVFNNSIHKPPLYQSLIVTALNRISTRG